MTNDSLQENYFFEEAGIVRCPVVVVQVQVLEIYQKFFLGGKLQAACLQFCWKWIYGRCFLLSYLLLFPFGLLDDIFKSVIKFLQHTNFCKTWLLMLLGDLFMCFKLVQFIALCFCYFAFILCALNIFSEVFTVKLTSSIFSFTTQ